MHAKVGHVRYEKVTNMSAALASHCNSQILNFDELHN